MRAVLDPNVLISGLLSRGSPARVLRAWLDGAFELVVSLQLIGEFERVLAYPKIHARVEPSEAGELVDLLRRSAQMADDPENSPGIRSPDPGDAYLIALAETAHAVIVSGDGHLLGLAGRLPVFSPAEFVVELEPRP